MLILKRAPENEMVRDMLLGVAVSLGADVASLGAEVASRDPEPALHSFGHDGSDSDESGDGDEESGDDAPEGPCPNPGEAVGEGQQVDRASEAQGGDRQGVERWEGGVPQNDVRDESGGGLIQPEGPGSTADEPVWEAQAGDMTPEALGVDTLGGRGGVDGEYMPEAETTADKGSGDDASPEGPSVNPEELADIIIIPVTPVPAPDNGSDIYSGEPAMVSPG
jgi:hypothetical protein